MNQPFHISLSAFMLLTALEIATMPPGYPANFATLSEPSPVTWVVGQPNNPPTPSSPGGSR